MKKNNNDRELSDKSKSIFGDVLPQDGTNDDLTIEAILAEFGGGKKQRDTEQQSAEPVAPPAREQKPDLPQKSAAPVGASDIKPLRQTGQEPRVISFKAAQGSGMTTAKDDARENAPVSRPAPVPSSEEVSLETFDDDGPVIDLGTFDRIYEKKQKKIKLLKEQIISNEKAAIKARIKSVRSRKIGSLKPATLKTAPIPLPLSAKAALDAQRLKASASAPSLINPKSVPRAKEPAEEKKPKKPVNPYVMMKKFGKLKTSLAVRTWIAFILALPLIYIAAGQSLSLPVPELLDFAKNPSVYTVISLGLLFAVIIVGYDVYFGGCYDLLTLRPSCDSLVFCSSIASLGHCVYSVFDSSALTNASGDPAYAPVCALPALAIAFSLLGDRIRCKTYYRSLRNSYRLTHSKVLSVLPEKYDGDIIYAAAHSDNLQGFFKSMRENDTVVSAMLWLSPVIILASLGLAFYANSMGPGRAPFFWCWSVTSAFAPALGYFLGATLPLSAVAKRMYKNGVLFGGGRAVSRLGSRSFVLLNDHDIFPGEAISINGFKLINRDEKEFAISMTASLLDAAGTSLAKPFLRLASDNYASIRPVSGLNISDSGGISGYIDGHNVMVGSGSYIQRCGIKIPADIKLRTAVFCAVDTELLIIFAVRYVVMPRNDYSMSLLEDNGYFPIIASRDFNVTASFIQNRFGIPSSELVYPAADLRTSMSDPSLTLEAGGILISRGCCGESIAESLVACHRYKTVAKLALVFSMFSSIIGIGLGALMAYNGWSAAASPVNMLLYYILWLLPVILFTGWVNRF